MILRMDSRSSPTPLCTTIVIDGWPHISRVRGCTRCWPTVARGWRVMSGAATVAARCVLISKALVAWPVMLRLCLGLGICARCAGGGQSTATRTVLLLSGCGLRLSGPVSSQGFFPSCGIGGIICSVRSMIRTPLSTAPLYVRYVGLHGLAHGTPSSSRGSVMLDSWPAGLQWVIRRSSIGKVLVGGGRTCCVRSLCYSATPFGS